MQQLSSRAIGQIEEIEKEQLKLDHECKRLSYSDCLKYLNLPILPFRRRGNMIETFKIKRVQNNRVRVCIECRYSTAEIYRVELCKVACKLYPNKARNYFVQNFISYISE